MENGQIHVYDKTLDKFYRTSSINLFIENDRNTHAGLEGDDNDVIERMYASLDHIFAGALQRVTATGKVSGADYKLILFFAYLSKWRVRQYDDSFKEAKNAYSVNDLGLEIKDALDGRLDINLEELFQTDIQQEFKRFLLAVQPFRFKDDYHRLVSNSFLLPAPVPAFITDCPFNEATIDSDNIFEDFIFPVTSDLTLVYSTRIDTGKIREFLMQGNEQDVLAFKKDFSWARDVSALDLSERLVASCDEEYLKHAVSVYKSFRSRNTGTAYHLTVYNVLYRFEEFADRSVQS